MKLYEIATDLPNQVTVQYVTQSELNNLMHKHKVVTVDHQAVFNYKPIAKQLSSLSYMAAVLSDVPANVTRDQLFKIAKLMYPSWGGAIADQLVDSDLDDARDMFIGSAPSPEDPTKHAVLVMPFKVWASDLVDWLDSNSDDYDDEDDFDEEDR